MLPKVYTLPGKMITLRLEKDSAYKLIYFPHKTERNREILMMMLYQYNFPNFMVGKPVS